MSLRVWLPLNGNYKNQGLNGNIVPEVMGTGITFTSGKIGQAATFPNNCNSCIHMPGFNLQEGTICAWVKINGESSGANQRIISEGRDSYSDGTELILNKAGTQMTFKAHKVSVSTNVELNKWIHVVGVFGNNNISLFINGIKKSSTTYTEATPYDYSNNRFVLGKMSYSYTSTGNYFPFNGQLNDVRVYDHCLSKKEVEEISKGLVLHYKLDGDGKGNDNILINTHFDNRYIQSSGWDTSKNGTLLANSWGGYNSGVNNQATVYHAHLKEFNGEYVYEYIKTTNESWLGISQGGLQTKIIAGQTYTFSWEEYHVDGTNRVGTGLYYYKTGATSANFHLGIQSDANITRVFNQWQKYSYTFTAPSDADYNKNISWYIYGHYNGNGTFYMRHPKLELGNSATSWTPNSNDGIYNLYNTSIIYDSSGYQNNGEIINNISIISDTPRYNAATHMSATNQKIKISNFPTSGFGNSYTFAWWEKISSVTPMHWGFADGIRLNGMYTGRLWNTGDGSNNPLYNPGTTTQVTTPTANVWHHWVMTGNGSKCLVYQDGELWAEAKTYKSISGQTIYINGWDSGTSYCSDNASMSDFRIYCTALTAEQVKELYNTSATIDKNGNVYAREVIE